MKYKPLITNTEHDLYLFKNNYAALVTPAKSISDKPYTSYTVVIIKCLAENGEVTLDTHFFNTKVLCVGLYQLEKLLDILALKANAIPQNQSAELLTKQAIAKAMNKTQPTL